MFTGLEYAIDGRPIRIEAFAKWRNEYGTDVFDLTEAFHLMRTNTGTGYEGSSSQNPPRLTIELADTADKLVYDVKISVDLWGWIFATYTWLGVRMDFRKPFGSPMLENVWMTEEMFVKVKILA